MQDNLRLMIFTIIGVVVAWFMVMIIDIHMFLHSDINDSVSGEVPMMRTDIGDQCGSEYVNSATLVDFKLNNSGQIVYLCPLGMSPIRKTVIANTLPAAFRNSLTPAQKAKITVTYPDLTPQVIPAAQPMNGAVPQQVVPVQSAAPAAQANPAPAPSAATIPVQQPAAPVVQEAPQPQQQPMGNTPPPIQPNSIPVPTPAPAQ